MSARLIVCLLLLGTCLPAIARTATAEAGTDAPCPPAASAPQAEALLDTPNARRAPAPGSASKSRPAATGGGEVESATRGPRWHSFLPGMFR